MAPSIVAIPFSWIHASERFSMSPVIFSRFSIHASLPGDFRLPQAHVFRGSPVQRVMNVDEAFDFDHANQLVTPTSGTSHHLLCRTIQELREDQGPWLGAGLDLALTRYWNLLNRYPIVEAPLGLLEDRMPTGMQVIGQTFSDIDPFQFASNWAQLRPSLFTDGRFPSFA